MSDDTEGKILEIRDPLPPEVRALCFAVAERVCDAIQGRPIGFDFLRAIITDDNGKASHELRQRICTLRALSGVNDPDPSGPTHAEPIDALAERLIPIPDNLRETE